MTESSHFEGFPPAALKFFADLKENNTREWFKDNRSTFDNDVIEPAKAFILSLGEMLQSLHPGFGFDTKTNGSGSLFRIYRDVRFSQDKSPYKTHIGIKFWLGNKPKKTENPSFYVGVGSKGAGVYSGLWQFPKPMLEQYRQQVDDIDTGEQLSGILDALTAAGYDVGEPHYKRVPRGFNADHPNSALLKRNAISAAMPKIDPAIVTSPDFVPTCFGHCVNMWPLVEWLHEHIS